MIVKCTSIKRNITGIDPLMPSIKIGSQYHVLSIYKDKQKNIYYQIEASAGRHESLGFFHSDQFEVKDNSWPNSWVEERFSEEIFVAPKPWQRKGFWEDFYDGSSEALQTYIEEREKILGNA